MKKVSGLVIVLAGSVLGGYYGMGMVTEKAIKKNMDVINRTNGLHAELQNYKRGWFDSKADIQWTLHIPERVTKDANGVAQTTPAQDFKFEMPVKIYHGPFMYADHKLRFGMGFANSEIQLPKDLAEQFSQNFTKESVQPKLDLNIAVNYLNQSTLGFSVPSFKLKDKDGHSTLDWMGISSWTYMSSNMGKIKGAVKFSGMTFTKDDVNVTLGKIKSKYNLHETDSGLYLGEASLDVPKVAVVEKEQKLFELKALSISSESDIDDHLFYTSLDVSLDRIQANGKQYGPAELTVNLKNLDADVLAVINQQANAMQQGSDAEKQQAMLMMLPELPKLFNKGAEFEISKLNVTLPEGQIEGHLALKLPAGDAANPFQMFQKIDGDAHLQVPVEITKLLMQQMAMQNQSDTSVSADDIGAQIDKQLASFQETGLIQMHDKNYTIDVQLKEGKFMVNGKPFDPSMVKVN